MANFATEAHPAQNTSALVADDIAQYVFKKQDELYSMDRREVESFQLRCAQRRFEELTPGVAALKDQADQNGVTAIRALNDLIPLLFKHTVYKSYPMSLIENNRFDMLTRWLQRATTVDLSTVDVSRCRGIDDWMDTLEMQTPLQVFHTSGTSGKLTFLPRTSLEENLWYEAYLKIFEGFGTEAGARAGGTEGIRLPVIYPSVRNGRSMSQRVVKFLARNVAPSPDECYTLTNGTLSADLLALSGRIRIAQAKGEVSKLKLGESQREAIATYLEEHTRRPQEMAEFFNRMIHELNGQRVLLFSQTSYLVQASREGLARNIRNVFAPNSLANTGGGGKEIVLPPNWKNMVQEFTGIPEWKLGYGMTEMTGPMPMCPNEVYHIPPYFIPFLLDPESGDALPRCGRQTGRFAALDLAAQHLWGGLITGDMLTIQWDSACPCGRQGAYIEDTVTRYAVSVTGDDKVTCAATIDNTDAALQTLLAG